MRRWPGARSSILLACAAAALVAGSLASPYAVAALSGLGSAAKPIHGIRCDRFEERGTHVHAHLDIIDGGRPIVVPANIGIPPGRPCFYWLHTHDTTGVIHVEAPAGVSAARFTLGDFLAIWGRSAFAGAGEGGFPIAIVDGRRYQGDPGGIALTAHRRITVEISPPVVPQPAFQFARGL